MPLKIGEASSDYLRGEGVGGNRPDFVIVSKEVIGRLCIKLKKIVHIC